MNGRVRVGVVFGNVGGKYEFQRSRPHNRELLLGFVLVPWRQAATLTPNQHFHVVLYWCGRSSRAGFFSILVKHASKPELLLTQAWPVGAVCSMLCCEGKSLLTDWELFLTGA